MSISSLQRRVAKSHSFEVDAGHILRVITQHGDEPQEVAERLGCTEEQALEILSLSKSVILYHALDDFYGKQKIASSVFKEENTKAREQFFELYCKYIEVYRETIELIGLNASIDQVLALSSLAIFKRRDWPKIRFVFATEIETIYKSHQAAKKAKLNKSEGEIQLEWNDRIKHSKGRKLTIADKVRISNAIAALSPSRRNMTEAQYMIAVAKESLVDIVQINQIE